MKFTGYYIVILKDSTAIHNSYYGKPRNVVYMNDVECNGDEADILNCDHILYDFDTGKNVLDIETVAGVKCPTRPTSIDITGLILIN